MPAASFPQGQRGVVCRVLERVSEPHANRCCQPNAVVVRGRTVVDSEYMASEKREMLRDGELGRRDASLLRSLV